MENFIQSTHSTLCFVFRNAQHYTTSVIKLNYDVISGFIAFLSEVIRLFVKCMNVTFNVVCTILEALIDFLTECFNFVRAFLQLLWKFVMLLFSILDLVFKGLEQVVYFIWSGGKWTAGALSASFENVKVIAVSIFDYLETFFTFFFKNVSSALYLFGTYSLNFIVGAYNFITWIFFGAASLVDNAMIYFADSVKYVVDYVYYALTDIFPNTPRETYMGILMIVLFYIGLVHAVSKLYSRGYTFPYPNHMNHNNVLYQRFGNEFSDDEFGMSADEETNDNNNSDTDSTLTSEDEDDDLSDDDEFSDEASELSVIDDESDDDRSSNDSDDSIEPIDIQLPVESQYNLRRSATPNRQKKKSTQDMEKEIERERERQMCVVCQDNKKSVLILPCRHMCLCIECGNRIARARPLTRRICPLCREKIRTIMNVYL